MPFRTISKKDIERLQSIVDADGPMNPADVKALAAATINMANRMNRLQKFLYEYFLRHIPSGERDFKSQTIIRMLGELKDLELPK